MLMQSDWTTKVIDYFFKALPWIFLRTLIFPFDGFVVLELFDGRTVELAESKIDGVIQLHGDREKQR
ncbi:hypothetical protein [Gloeobacter morelensis]|uniref:hypothetical protein n=1 Tax=Gloeobacter morelensis TaxID=2907343 RepID=UPI001E41FD8B|nr:hypothetical protein [Gloeobacter morelensis]UFP97125.1 hypothetical protein ISF26_23680 [Gloeobacter morelensis MG652769]